MAKGLFFAIKGPNFDGNDFALQALEMGAHRVVVDSKYLRDAPGCIYVPNCLVALQRLAHHHRMRYRIPVLALTGSNGKTTTKELLKAVLSQRYRVACTRGNLNNHLGVPLTLLQMGDDTELAIVEMGANHIGEIKWLCNIAAPDHGLITNIGDAHLEGFGSREKVKQGKTEMFRYLEAHRGQIFMNAGEPSLRAELSKYESTILYSFDNIPGKINSLQFETDSVLQSLTMSSKKGAYYVQSHLYGEYNQPNILTAVALGSFFGLSASEIRTGLESYIPDDNRSQIISLGGDSTMYLDAYNANPTSMLQALSFFLDHVQGGGVIALGDMKELGSDEIHEHQQIVRLLLGQPQLAYVLLIGPVFSDAYTELADSSPKFILFKDVSEAVLWWKNNLPTYQDVLLKGSRGMQLEKLAAVIKRSSQSSTEEDAW